VADNRKLILVDGRSGAGKSQWARDYLLRTPGFTLLSLDDIYPGWDGLDAGHRHVLHHAIIPWSRGESGRVRRFEWDTMRPSGEIHISPEANLVIEGCGSLSRLTAPFATERYWVEADSDTRKQRALERDGDMFAPHWTRWALQEDRFYRLHNSRDLADHIIST
jgi:uridine kinase